MKQLTTSLARDSHAYTHSKAPWLITVGESAYGRMINYLSGGGLRSFGRTLRQEEVLIRQRRFLWTSGVLAAVWLILYLF